MFKKKAKVEELGLTKIVDRTVVKPISFNIMFVSPSNCQHIGSRDNQEDAFAFSDFSSSSLTDSSGVLAVVADGMGGLDYGEEASRAAVAGFLSDCANDQGEVDISERLVRALNVANDAVYKLTLQGNKEKLNLGTTLIAAVVDNMQLYWVSAGDSRIYLYRNGNLKQITVDHIYANHLEKDLQEGIITAEAAAEHPERAYLTSYLGLISVPEVFLSEIPLPLQPGDRIILCSDGLHDTLTNEEIASVINTYSGSDIAGELVAAALDAEKRYQDNITVAVLAIDCK